MRERLACTQCGTRARYNVEISTGGGDTTPVGYRLCYAPAPANPLCYACANQLSEYELGPNGHAVAVALTPLVTR